MRILCIVIIAFAPCSLLMAQKEKCELKYYMGSSPKDLKFKLLGTCKARAPNSALAFRRLDRCACKLGGNALILMNQSIKELPRDYSSKPTYREIMKAQVILVE